jgi:hypothetical protein
MTDYGQFVLGVVLQDFKKAEALVRPRGSVEVARGVGSYASGKVISAVGEAKHS